MYGKEQIKQRLSEWGLAYKKRWGQNFLCDKTIADKIVKQAYSLLEKEKQELPQHIWEIGAGLGALSESLYAHNPEGMLTVFEIDYGIISMLHHYMKEAHIEHKIHIVSGDAEKTMSEHIQKNQQNPLPFPTLLCGNLPYNAGVRIMIAASCLPSVWTSLRESPIQSPSQSPEQCSYIPMCVMLQKESAERIVSPPHRKQYGISSVLLQTLYDISISFEVDATCFYPVPHVDSVICSLTPKKNIPFYTRTQLQTLQQIVHASFGQRRKILNNTLGHFLQSKGIEDYENLCQSVGISMKHRAENISPEQFMNLALLVGIAGG